nr:tryptophan-rich sensory protein [uncultured Corynebacterium sp.]
MAIITVVGVAAAIVMAFIGSGALGGTPVAEAAGGALSADATPLAPAGTAFSIWSVIYVGLAAYAIWQLTPVARRSERQRVLRPWAILSAFLNGAWLWTVQLDALWLSVAVILVLLAVLVRIMYVLGRPRTGGAVELVLTDGTFGLYFGWVLVATFANVYATFAAEGITAFEEISVGVVGIVVAAGVAVLAAIRDGGRIAPALATAWDLAWVAVARTEGTFDSQLLTWTAAGAAVVVLVAAVAKRTTARAVA